MEVKVVSILFRRSASCVLALNTSCDLPSLRCVTSTLFHIISCFLNLFVVTVIALHVPACAFFGLYPILFKEHGQSAACNKNVITFSWRAFMTDCF